MMRVGTFLLSITALLMLALPARAQSPVVMDRLIDQMIAAIGAHPTSLETSDMWPAYYEREDSDRETVQEYVQFGLHALSSFGPAAIRAAPAIRKILAWDDYPDTRIEAIQALVALGDKEAIPALQGLAGKFDADYQLAYVTIEALSRLGDQDARFLAARLAQHYWYKPVRINAERAQQFFIGGVFDHDQMKGDGARSLSPTGYPPLNRDMDQAEETCHPHDKITYAQHKPKDVEWPARGKPPVFLKFESLTEAQIKRVMNRPDRGLKRALSVPSFYVEIGDDEFFGFDRGEWGGAVFWRGRDGVARPFIDGNASAVLKVGRRLFFVSGFSHFGFSHGYVHIVDLTRTGPKRVASIRLPSEAYFIGLIEPDTLLFVTAYGDMVMRADGTVLDPRHFQNCRAMGFWDDE